MRVGCNRPDAPADASTDSRPNVNRPDAPADASTDSRPNVPSLALSDAPADVRALDSVSDLRAHDSCAVGGANPDAVDDAPNGR